MEPTDGEKWRSFMFSIAVNNNDDDNNNNNLKHIMTLQTPIRDLVTSS